jgi:AraC family transcriptional regulator
LYFFTMHVWSVPLSHPPTITLCGVVDHGQQPVDRFWLARTWTMHIYAYEAELLLDGQAHDIRPGMAGVIAPGVQQEYRYQGRSPHVYAHLELPADGPLTPIPVLIDLGREAAAFRSRLSEAVGDFAVRPQRCRARIWDLLWELARRGEDAGVGEGDQRVARVMAHLERSLDQPVSVPHLANQVGLSHNQLTRLFRHSTGDTVIGYVRRRRVEKAVYLLSRTDQPIAAIARQVGIPDPAAFAKTVRALAGRAPSDFRS